MDSPSFDVNSKESIEKWYTKTSGEIIKRVASSDQFEEERRRFDESQLSQESKTLLYGRDSPDRKIHLILLLTDGKEISAHLAEKLNSLAQYAAIIPVISKADTYEVTEIKRAKEVFIRCSRVAGVEWFDAKSVVLIHRVSEKQSEQGLS